MSLDLMVGNVVCKLNVRIRRYSLQVVGEVGNFCSRYSLKGSVAIFF